MRAVDTNVLVRLLTRDDDKQVAAAEAFAAKGVWISHLVVAETAWVLRAVYDFDRADIARALDMLLQNHRVTIQDREVLESALVHYRQRQAVGFSDCLLLEIARKAGHLPLGTFDKALSRLEDVERL
jgi:predicted nucleic-acid-binding protein